MEMVDAAGIEQMAEDFDVGPSEIGGITHPRFKMTSPERLGGGEFSRIQSAELKRFARKTKSVTINVKQPHFIEIDTFVRFKFECSFQLRGSLWSVKEQ